MLCIKMKVYFSFKNNIYFFQLQQYTRFKPNMYWNGTKSNCLITKFCFHKAALLSIKFKEFLRGKLLEAMRIHRIFVERREHEVNSIFHGSWLKDFILKSNMSISLPLFHIIYKNINVLFVEQKIAI